MTTLGFTGAVLLVGMEAGALAVGADGTTRNLAQGSPVAESKGTETKSKSDAKVFSVCLRDVR